MTWAGAAGQVLVEAPPTLRPPIGTYADPRIRSNRGFWATVTGRSTLQRFRDFTRRLPNGTQSKFTTCLTVSHFYRAAWNADAVLRWEFRPSVCPSVRPSVRPSNAWIVTKRQKDMFRYLHDTKDNLSLFSEKKNCWWGGDPFYLKFCVKLNALERNRRFSIYFRS